MALRRGLRVDFALLAERPRWAGGRGSLFGTKTAPIDSPYTCSLFEGILVADLIIHLDEEG